MFLYKEGHQFVCATSSCFEECCEYCKDSDKHCRDDTCTYDEVQQIIFVMVVAIVGSSVSTSPLGTQYQLFFYSKEFLGKCPNILSAISVNEPYFTTSLSSSLNPYETGLSLHSHPEFKNFNFNDCETSIKFSGRGSVNDYTKAFRKIWFETVYAEPLKLTMNLNENPHVKGKK